MPLFKEGDFEINAEGCTAKVIYEAIIKSFSDHSVPLTNIIGFATDGCNVMMGAHNSVSSRLRNDLPGIKIFKCICHSMHLCTSEACKQLPRRCEDLARNIYSILNIVLNDKQNMQNFKSLQTRKYIKYFIRHKRAGYHC